ncbi:MAG: SGNH/GDSL hydrolase family protein [Ruminococcus sp.]|nr:SGNH/GDSL hydrolase family protein [Candidatus Apopatosoma intestinale]
MKKIEVFGDSVLQGVIFTGSRYKLSGRSLEENMEKRGVSLHRSCRMGSTIDAGMERLRSFAAENPDLSGTTVLLEFGGNDCAYDWKAVSENPDGEHAPKTDRIAFAARYEEAVALCREHGADVAIATLIPIDAEKYMNFISRGLSYDNIMGWLGDVSMLYRWHEKYNRTVELLAEKTGCPLVDLRESFLLSHDFSSLLCADGIHPTEQGHKLIENTLLQCMA